MTDESFNEKLVGEMFIAYVSNNSVEPSQIADVVRAISRAFLRTTMKNSRRDRTLLCLSISRSRRIT